MNLRRRVRRELFPRSGGLRDRLVGYWRLDEASGSRLDSSGNGFTLTDNNTVASTTGLVNTAAVFVRASSERLSRADQPEFEVGAGAWTICGWLKPTTLGGIQQHFAGYTNGSAVGWRFQIFTDNAVRIVPFDGTTVLQAIDLTVLVVGTWYFVAAWFDPTEQRSSVQVNMGTINKSSVHGTPPFTLPNNVNEFNLGFTNGGSPNYFDGHMDEWGYWVGRVLSQAELSYLYNAGVGRMAF